jgi:uncharacterized protein YraI
LPQFNWAVMGPIVLFCALLIGGVFFIGSHLPRPSVPAQGSPIAKASTLPTVTAPAGIVLSGRVIGTPHVRSSPNSDSAVLRDLQSGQTVTVSACAASCAWYRVAESDQASPGWVSSAFIQVQGDDQRLPVQR